MIGNGPPNSKRRRPYPGSQAPEAIPLTPLKEACGVFGAYCRDRDVARLTFYGLYALQHRGQESAGIATSDGQVLHVRTGMGLVAQVFEEGDIRNLPGPSPSVIRVIRPLAAAG